MNMSPNAALQVLDPHQSTVTELIAKANDEYRLTNQAGETMVEHAIRCGEHLLTLEEWYLEAYARGDVLMPWLTLLNQQFDGGRSQAHTYIRLARFKEIVRLHGFESLNSARLHLTEIGAKGGTGRKPPPDWLLHEMKRLRSEGWTIKAVADHIGKNRGYVQHWCADAAAQQRKKQKSLAYWRSQQAAKKALQNEHRDQAIKRAVRKSGAATAEAWTMAERMQDVIAQAQREATDPEGRRALSRAGEHHRKMRDEIVRALGIA